MIVNDLSLKFSFFMLKPLYALLPILMVLSIGIMQAEAYEGNIDVNVMNSDITIGDIVSYKGMLIDIKPPSDAVVQIKLLDIDASVIDTMSVSIDPQVTIIGEDDKTWNFEFEIDTSKYDLLTDVMYTVQAVYEDKIEETELTVYPSLEQSIIDTGNVRSDSMIEDSSQIPEWVRNVFTFWVEKQISDQELISAIEFLVETGIVKIENPLS